MILGALSVVRCMQNTNPNFCVKKNKFDPRNTTDMPVVKSIFCLEHRRNFHVKLTFHK